MEPNISTPGASLWLRAARALVLILLALIPVFFWRGAIEPFEACKASLLHLVALLIAGCLICSGAPFRDRFWREPIALAMSLSLASAVVSTVFSVSPRASFWGGWDSHQGLLTVASLYVLFVAARTVFTGDDLPTLAAAVAVGFAITAGYAAIQALQGDPFDWSERSHFSTYVRPIGTLGHPNYLAGYLVMAIPLLLWWFGSSRRLTILIALAIAAAVIVASLSRAAWVALILLLVLSWVRLRGRTRLWIGSAFAALLVGVLALAWLNLLGPLGKRLQNVAVSPSRTAMWKVGGDIFLEFPLIGSGLDTFQLAFTRHRSLEYWRHEFGFTPTHAHNDALDLLATQGAFGLGCYLLLAGAVVFAARRIWHRRPDQRGPVLALCGVSLGYFAQNWFGFPVIATASLHAVALGCLSRLGDPSPPPARPQAANWPIALGAALSCLVMPINLFFEPMTPASFYTPAALAFLAVPFVLSGYDRNRLALGSVAFRPALWHGVVLLGVLVSAWTVSVRPFAAWCLLRHGEDSLDADAPRSLAYFERAVSAAPWLDTPVARLASARHRAATIHGHRHLLASAVTAAERARDRVPANSAHHAAVGRMALDLVRDGKARPEAVWNGFDKSLALDPRNTLLLLDAARAAFLLGDVGRAREYITRGKALTPDLAPLIAEEGVLAIAEGRLEDAERLLRLATEEKWDGQSEALGRANGLLAAVCFQLEDYDEALAQADRALRRHPSPNTYEVATRWVRAAALERLGGEMEAREECDRILALRPDHAAALDLLHRTR